MKRTLALLWALLLLFPACLAEDADPWICLSCGQEAQGVRCACGELRGAWYCVDCGRKNLSDTCAKCGKGRDLSIVMQSRDPRPAAAWPYVRYLAASGDAAALFQLGQYYEKGIIVEKDPEQALHCFRTAGEMGHVPAWLYLGKIYDSDGWINWDWIIGQGAAFTMVVGARGTGKTYGLMKYCQEHDRPFIYLRRLKSQLDQCAGSDGNPFKKLNADTGHDVVPRRTAGGVIFSDQDRIVFFAAGPGQIRPGFVLPGQTEPFVLEGVKGLVPCAHHLSIRAFQEDPSQPGICHSGFRQQNVRCERSSGEIEHLGAPDLAVEAVDPDRLVLFSEFIQRHLSGERLKHAPVIRLEITGNNCCFFHQSLFFLLSFFASFPERASS